MTRKQAQPDEGGEATENAPDRVDDEGESAPNDTDEEPVAPDTSAVGSGGSQGNVIEELPQFTTGADGPAETITTDRLFELLASPGNRFVLTYLLRVDSPANREDLVEYVVERAVPPDGLSEGKFRGKVTAQFVHSTLPQLADAGLVELDDDGETVRATQAVDSVAPYLALAVAQSDS